MKLKALQFYTVINTYLLGYTCRGYLQCPLCEALTNISISRNVCSIIHPQFKTLLKFILW